MCIICMMTSSSIDHNEVGRIDDTYSMNYFQNTWVELSEENFHLPSEGNTSISPANNLAANNEAEWSLPSANTFDLYFGKILKASMSFTDEDGISSADLQRSWHHLDGANFIQVGSGDRYTVSETDEGKELYVRFSFTDDNGNFEQSPYVRIGPAGNLAYEPNTKVNSTRITVDFTEYADYLSSMGISEDPINLLVGDGELGASNVSKWGAEFGQPSTVTYSISNPGQLFFSENYVNDLAFLATLGDATADDIALSEFYGDLVTLSSQEAYAAKEFSEQQKLDIEDALSDWTALTGITFNEVAHDITAPADIIFTKLDFDVWSVENTTVKSTSAGFAFLPHESLDFYMGDIFIDTTFSNPFKQVITHEIGHALGLSHPFDGRIKDPDIPNYQSVMSYDSANNFLPISPMQLDLDAVEALYGQNTFANTGNTPYVVDIDAYNPVASFKLREMIHDANGSDTLTLNSVDKDNSSVGIYLNLKPGSFSNFSDNTKIVDANTTSTLANFYLSDATQIETVTTTLGHDVVDADVDWAVTVDLGDGNDTVLTEGYGAILNGGSGTADTLKIKATDFTGFYIETPSAGATNGTIRDGEGNAFCVASDFEFVSTIEAASTNDYNWAEFVTAFAAPALGGGDGGSGGTGAASFEITPVPLNEGETILSGRFGDIITFGVQYVGTDDMDAAETIDLESFDFRIEWEGDEYAFWGGDGGFAAESATPTNGDPEVDMNANGILITSYAGKYLGNGADETAGTEDDEYIPDSQSYLSFSTGAPAGVTYTEGDYIATFMLERIDTSGATENTITLSKSNHSTPEQYWDVDDNGTPANPDDDIYTAVMDATRPGPIDFTETYDQDTVSVSIANARGNEIANPTLYAANGTVTDGLSLVPVIKMGNLTKYEVVLNVSKPMIMNGAASVAATQGITIAGQRIFESSIVEKADLDSSSNAMAAVGASAITAATTDSGLTDVISSVQIAGASFTEHGFYRLAAEVFDDDANTTSNLSDLKLIDGLDLTIAGLAEPTSEGRYTIAEFVAIDEGTSIEFTNDDVNWITIEAVDVGDATTDDNGTPSDPGDDFEVPWSYNVNDGSDIVVLGESYYSNPGTYRDAIGAEDALGALRISVDPAGHSTSQIIAADFDVNGTVTAMDAYNILQYAVYGEQTTNYLPNWVYIDDIDEVTTVTGTADTYDNNIDMFIGTDYHVDATGVLRGDVSASYENLPPQDDVMEYNIDGLNMAVSWNPVMDGATAHADTDWTFNMQGPNASATLDFGIEDSNWSIDGDFNILWNDDTGFYDGVVVVRNFDIGFDELIVEIVPGASIMNGAIDAAIDAGGTEDDIIHTADIKWDDLINDDDLGILGVRNEQISILTITDSESFASKYGGSSNNLQLLLIDTDQDGAIETGNGEFVALIDNYGGLLTPSNLFDVLTLDGLDTVVA